MAGCGGRRRAVSCRRARVRAPVSSGCFPCLHSVPVFCVCILRQCSALHSVPASAFTFCAVFYRCILYLPSAPLFCFHVPRLYSAFVFNAPTAGGGTKKGTGALFNKWKFTGITIPRTDGAARACAPRRKTGRFDDVGRIDSHQ